MGKRIRQILFKIISVIVIMPGVVLLALNIPQLYSLDKLYDSKYKDCEKREERIYNQRGHSETKPYTDAKGNTLYTYEVIVSDYNKKDCVEEASKFKQEEKSSIQFWVILGAVAVIFGIILLFISFI